MTVIPLRQRSSTEIVDAALQLYRRDPVPFILGSALIYVPWTIVQVLLGLGAKPTDVTSATTTGFISLIGTTIVYMFVGGVTTIIASDVYFGRQTDVAAAFRTVARRLNALGGATLTAGAFIFIGIMLLLVPGMYLACRFFAVRPAVLLENLSAGDAMRRSSALSLDNKLRIFATLLLIWILAIAISVGGATLFALIPSSIVRVTLTTLLSAIVYPVFGITETLLYYDMRIRREGFDVEYLASSAIAGDTSMPATT